MQSEYSIFSRDIEDDVIPACLEVGASLVAYSPLGRGLLTGRLIEAVDLAQSCTPAQIALAWVIANLGACAVELSHDERMTLDALAARVMGDRYDPWGMAGING